MRTSYHRKGGQYGVLAKSEAKDLMTTDHASAEGCIFLSKMASCVEAFRGGS